MSMLLQREAAKSDNYSFDFYYDGKNIMFLIFPFCVTVSTKIGGVEAIYKTVNCTKKYRH